MSRELKELVKLTKNYIQDLIAEGISSIVIDSNPRSGQVISATNGLKSNIDYGASSMKQKSVIRANPQVKTLKELYLEIKDCQSCALGKTRNNFVFGEGNPEAELVFVGEAPGFEEDRQGRPFVGRAGELLTKIIEAMKLRREDVYIGNVLKCRPPANRTPLPEEVVVCQPYLNQQLALLKKKKIICCLGLSAAKCLLKLDLSLKVFREQWYEYQGTPVKVTYHPAYLLRAPQDKGKVWDDMKKVMACLRK